MMKKFLLLLPFDSDDGHFVSNMCIRSQCCPIMILHYSNYLFFPNKSGFDFISIIPRLRSYLVICSKIWAILISRGTWQRSLQTRSKDTCEELLPCWLLYKTGNFAFSKVVACLPSKYFGKGPSESECKRHNNQKLKLG